MQETPVHATKLLQHVHTDVAGPISPISHKGHKFIIDLIDEYSSMIILYPLRSKDEASSALQKFIAAVAPVRKFGGKDTSQVFPNIFLQHGIKYTSTAPYSPYQNKKAERAWRSTQEMARCLISDANLPKNL